MHERISLWGGGEEKDSRGNFHLENPQGEPRAMQQMGRVRGKGKGRTRATPLLDSTKRGEKGSSRV